MYEIFYYQLLSLSFTRGFTGLEDETPCWYSLKLWRFPKIQHHSYSTMTGLASASRPVKLALLTSGAQCAVSGSSIAKGVLGAAVWGFSRSVRLDTWRSRMNAAEIFWSWDWDGLRWPQLYMIVSEFWMFTSADVMVQHLRKFLTCSWRWSTCQWISLWESFCQWKPSCTKIECFEFRTQCVLAQHRPHKLAADLPTFTCEGLYFGSPCPQILINIARNPTLIRNYSRKNPHHQLIRWWPWSGIGWLEQLGQWWGQGCRTGRGGEGESQGVGLVIVYAVS